MGRRKTPVAFSRQDQIDFGNQLKEWTAKALTTFSTGSRPRSGGFLEPFIFCASNGHKICIDLSHLHHRTNDADKTLIAKSREKVLKIVTTLATDADPATKRAVREIKRQAKESDLLATST